MAEKATAQQKVRGEKAKKEGEEFLAADKAKDGVKTLPSGLQYKVLSEGNGARPEAEQDQVTVNYRGTLVDGTEFDSSYKRGEPVTFGVSEVIKGWSESLPMMKSGAKSAALRPGRTRLRRTRRAATSGRTPRSYLRSN